MKFIGVLKIKPLWTLLGPSMDALENGGNELRRFLNRFFGTISFRLNPLCKSSQIIAFYVQYIIIQRHVLKRKEMDVISSDFSTSVVKPFPCVRTFPKEIPSEALTIHGCYIKGLLSKWSRECHRPMTLGIQLALALRWFSNFPGANQALSKMTHFFLIAQS